MILNFIIMIQILAKKLSNFYLIKSKPIVCPPEGKWGSNKNG